ncbi:MAG: hypothetical protein Q8R02_17890 [Hyphomonadaceae bacterium]|nr:hypothetical protein [Hyphomonadaceae bacterium]
MSYDLLVFDPAAPPADRIGFLSWYTDMARAGDGRLVTNPVVASAPLQAWYRDMIKGFPATSGPDNAGLAAIDNDNRAEYRFAPGAVFAAFQWEASRHAQRQAVKLARTHNVGFFDVSGNDGTVWGPSAKGFYQVLHRNGLP